MRCPKCRLINPDDALRCDCGYDFTSGTMKSSYVTGTGRFSKAKLREIAIWHKRAIFLFIAHLMLICLAAAIGSLLADGGKVAVGIILIDLFISMLEIAFLYELNAALNMCPGFVFVILILLSGIKFVALFVLAHDAARLLRSNGISVGLFGVQRSEFAKLAGQDSITQE